MKKLFSHGVFFVAMLLVPASAFAKKANTQHFHRAGQAAHETRYELDWLATFELEVMGGRATKGYNASKDSVNALRIYGSDKIGMMAAGAVGNPAVANLNGDLLQIQNQSGALVDFDGKFSMFEANFSYVQNFCHGFFLDINLPVKRLKIGDITRSASDDSTLIGANARALRSVVANLPEVTALYDLNIEEASKTGIGDMFIGLGWTCNNDDIENIDFLDTTIKLGVSAPTAKAKDQNKAFELALGYEKHTGISAEFDLGIGFYEWITMGAHVGGLFFFDKTMNMRMRTVDGQQGWMKLLKGDAEHDMGNIWNVGGHVKADHIFKGFSLMFGYNYARKGDDHLTPVNTTQFPTDVVNKDDQLKGWRQHAITVTLEYDMAEEGRKWNPYFSVFYSRPVAGKYIFATDAGGGTAGLNVAMDF